LVLESFDTDFTRVGIWLALNTGVAPADFRALTLASGSFLVVTNACKYNHMLLITSTKYIFTILQKKNKFLELLFMTGKTYNH
jgi:hypothetical protein